MGTCQHAAQGGFAGSAVSQEDGDLPLVQIQGQIFDRSVAVPSRVIHLWKSQRVTDSLTGPGHS